MKRLSLFASLLFIIGQAIAQPVQLAPPTPETRVAVPFTGKWLPNSPSLHVGVKNYTTLRNLRYTDTGLETVEGYSKITANAMTQTPISGYHFLKDSVSEIITKAYTGSYYYLYRNTTAIPGAGDYETTSITEDAYYSDYSNLDSSIGWFSDGPNGIMLYADSSEGVLLYGGDYIKPAALFCSSDSAFPITDYNDLLEEALNELPVAAAVSTYNSATQEYLYIGSPWLITDITFDVVSANTTTSTLSLTVWDGQNWTAKTITDGTSSGGKALAQDGTIEITSSSVTPKVAIVNNQQYLWYRLQLSAGSATFRSINLRAPLQNITDVWNGSGRTCIGFHAYRNGEYEDYTYQVSQASTNDSPYSATIGGLDGSDRIDLVFEEPIQGIYIKMLEGLTNKKSSTISSISHWNGSSYASVSGIIDETLDSTDSKTLNQSGVISWSKTSLSPKAKEVFGVYGYSYRIVFSAAITDAQKAITSTSISFVNATSTVHTTVSSEFEDFEVGDTIKLSGSTSNDGTYTISSVNNGDIVVSSTLTDEAAGDSVTIVNYETSDHDGTSIDYIYGITTPLDLSSYSGVGYYGGRVMLINGNKVDYSLPDIGWVFNGVNTSNEGAPNPNPLYFGDDNEITATHSLSNRYGSNIIQSWVVTKNNETYSLTGTQPYTDYNEPFIIRKMSDTIGCPAPMTMKEIQISLEDIQRNGLMWLDSAGPVIFDGAVIAYVGGIENYFDPTNSEYIKTSLIEKATAYYDNTNYEYNLIFPSGSSATANNMWLVYDLKRRKWYRKAHGPACGGGCGAGESCVDSTCLPSNDEIPIYTIGVSDSDGIKYSYGHLSSGHLMRLDNTQAWDGSGIVQSIITGEFSPAIGDDNGFWTYSKLTGMKLISDATTEDADVTVNINVDGTQSSDSVTIQLDASDSVSRNTFYDKSLDEKGYLYQFKYSTTTDTDKWKPLMHGYKARYIRED